MLVKKISASRFYGVDGTTTEILLKEPEKTSITETAEVTKTPLTTETQLYYKEPQLAIREPILSTQMINEDAIPSPLDTTMPVQEMQHQMQLDPVQTTTNNLNIEYNIERRPLLLSNTPVVSSDASEPISDAGWGGGGGFGGGGGGGAIEEEIIAPKKKSKWWLWLLVAGGVYGVSKMKKK